MTEHTAAVRGPLMIDIAGTALSAQEARWLADERVGGLILFSRNFVNAAQVTELVQAIRAASADPLLIAVDHEGGRVQRFREGFSRVPPMRELGAYYDREPEAALQLALDTGSLIAAELAAVGIDFSFTPVVDIDTGQSGVIGDRAFHHDPARVSVLADALMHGLHAAGMPAVAKHFPGHGFVAADSHLELPVDDRSLEDIRAQDLLPFRRLAEAGVEGVMPAHVLYPQVAPEPAGFSRFWIQDILRGELAYDGAVFSDDLSMAGALSAGTPLQRASAAMQAGCDMLLVCNDPQAVGEVLDGLEVKPDAARERRLSRLRRRDNTDTCLCRAQAIAAADGLFTVLA
ncbi:beta-N-acetylhexosaminidase [Granulosicoccaceae sp. 1_MG-2023]|nr:beta-N-acetylhexosaminidase [Granulosicoccaceae sp. 1_MG-2023]